MVQPMVSRKQGEPLGVCIMTSDFWGLHAAGGTATAYHLLAYVRPAQQEQQPRLVCLATAGSAVVPEHAPAVACMHGSCMGSRFLRLSTGQVCGSGQGRDLSMLLLACCLLCVAPLVTCAAQSARQTILLDVQVLGSLKEELQVTMVGINRDQEECSAAAPTNSRHGVQFECLQHKHFQPEVRCPYPCSCSSPHLESLCCCILSP